MRVGLLGSRAAPAVAERRCAFHVAAIRPSPPASAEGRKPRTAALLRIHDLAPHARVLVVGYPDLLPASDGGACALVLGITSGDVEYLNNAELQLNRMLSSQATASGDGYVDTYTPSTGRDACAAPSSRWIEPLIPAAPAAPVHPNAAGQQGIAAAVERAIASAG
jgi:hypothetical protein